MLLDFIYNWRNLLRRSANNYKGAINLKLAVNVGMTASDQVWRCRVTESFTTSKCYKRHHY